MAAKSLDVQGGDKLEAALKKLAARLASGDAAVNVGFLEGAKYPAGSESPGLPVAQVAFWNEFGTPAAQHPIPPRPFFRGAISQHQGEWGAQLGQALKSTKYDGKAALAIMGTIIKDEIVASIVATNDPPNAPATVARKGFNKPLIDTGVLQRSVDFVVTV